MKACWHQLHTVGELNITPEAQSNRQDSNPSPSETMSSVSILIRESEHKTGFGEGPEGLRGGSPYSHNSSLRGCSQQCGRDTQVVNEELFPTNSIPDVIYVHLPKTKQ